MKRDREKKKKNKKKEGNRRQCMNYAPIIFQSGLSVKELIVRRGEALWAGNFMSKFIMLTLVKLENMKRVKFHCLIPHLSLVLLCFSSS